MSEYIEIYVQQVKVDTTRIEWPGLVEQLLWAWNLVVSLDGTLVDARTDDEPCRKLRPHVIWLVERFLPSIAVDGSVLELRNHDWGEVDRYTYSGGRFTMVRESLDTDVGLAW